MASEKVVAPNKETGWFKYIFTAFVILSIIAIVVFSVTQSRNGKNMEASPPESVPSNLSMTVEYDKPSQGAYISFSTRDDVGYVMNIFSDPRCPICSKFEEQSKDDIYEALENGNAAVRVNMLTFLDDMTRSDYSKQSVAALYTIAENGQADVAWRFYNSFWGENQPPESLPASQLPGLEELKSLAKELGANDKTMKALEDMDVNAVADKVNTPNSQMLNSTIGQIATPAVFIDGEPQEKIMSKGWLDQFNEEAEQEKAENK